MQVVMTMEEYKELIESKENLERKLVERDYE